MSAEGFEAEIVSSEDPMVPWVHYITWAEKTDGVPRNAGRILRERCANAYITSERYRNDERYARVWLWLASAYEAEEPGSSGPLVFERLKEARVGAELALFWVAWAFIAEKARDFAQADALFASGTLAGARPQDMLARRRAEFERRLASSQRSGRATDRGHRRAPPSHGAPQPSRAPVPPSSSGSTMSFAIFDERGSSASSRKEAPPSSFSLGRTERQRKPSDADSMRRRDDEDVAQCPPPMLDGVEASFEEVRAVAYARSARARGDADRRRDAAPARCGAARDAEPSTKRAPLRVIGAAAAATSVEAAPPAGRAGTQPAPVPSPERDEARDSTCEGFGPRCLVFSTVKRHLGENDSGTLRTAAKQLRHAEQNDLTINSAFALSEMDSLFSCTDGYAIRKRPEALKEGPPPTPVPAPSFSIFVDE